MLSSQTHTAARLLIASVAAPLQALLAIKVRHGGVDIVLKEECEWAAVLLRVCLDVVGLDVETKPVAFPI
jgi:hypothetical protein